MDLSFWETIFGTSAFLSAEPLLHTKV